MKKDDKKTRKLRDDWSGVPEEWTVRGPLSADELDQLKKDSLEAFDKWVWETGSDEDKEKYKGLEKKFKKEMGYAEIQNEIDDIITKLGEDIRKTIDEDILTGILNSPLDNTDET